MGLFVNIDKVEYNPKKIKLEELFTLIKDAQKKITFCLFQERISGTPDALQQDESCDDAEIQLMIEIIYQNPSIFKKFKLKFDDKYQLSVKNAKLIMECLSDQSQIQMLSIHDDFYHDSLNNFMSPVYKHDTQNFYNELAQQTHLLERLTKFKLFLQSNIEFFKIINIIKQLKNLRILKFDFGRYYGFSDDGAELLGKTIMFCQNLEALQIYLQKANCLSEDGEKDLAEGIKQCKNFYHYSLYSGDSSSCTGEYSVDILKDSKIYLLKLLVLDGYQGYGVAKRKKLNQKTVRLFKHLVLFCE